MNFEQTIRAEFVTQHLMKELNIEPTLPIEMYLSLGYDLMIKDPKKWEAINKAYDLDIRRCLKQGVGNKKAFKYRPLKGQP